MIIDPLAELEAAVAQSKKKLKKKQDAPASDAAFLANPVSFDEPAFSLQPVFDFLDHLKKEPREILEARHLAMIGLPAPKEARHDWLVERVAYHFQIKHYQNHVGEFNVPRSVLDNNVNHALTYSGARAGETFDARDPDPNRNDPGVEIWDDTRVVACASNPYARGKSRAAFFAVEMSGQQGIGFEHLAKTVEGILECTVGAAQEWAYLAFTRDARVGLTRILIV